jgi:hypothetical protein
MRSANVLVVIGAILALLGIIGFAIPIFTTRETKDVAKVGDLKLQTTEAREHVIPPPVRRRSLPAALTNSAGSDAPGFVAG